MQKRKRQVPNYFRFKDYLLYFYAGDGTEPIHVHVAEKRPSKACAKFWLLENGTCKLAYNRADIPNKDLKKIEQFIELNFNVFCTKWKDFFLLFKIDFLTE